MNMLSSAARARYERRVYYPPRLRLMMMAFISAALGALSLLALMTGDAARSQVIELALAAALLVFASVGTATLLRLTKRRPVMVMDEDGLTVWVTPGRPEHLDWDAITDVQIFPAPRMQVLGVGVKPVQPHWADKAAFWKRTDQSLDFPGMAIPSVSVATPLRKVEAEIRRRVQL